MVGVEPTRELSGAFVNEFSVTNERILSSTLVNIGQTGWKESWYVLL